jgi:branched-chain amino acid transport system substrate-binding protein
VKEKKMRIHRRTGATQVGIGQRFWLVIGLVMVVCLGGFGAHRPACAASEVKIAVIVPLSGRWARQGELYKAGSEMAVDEINAQGGIKALGGAKLVLVPADAGDSVQKATSAAQRALSGGGITAAQGAWLSSFTLGATEVSERLGIPWLTHSWADKITDRDFRYVFQSSSVSSRLAEQGVEQAVALGKEAGVTVQRVALVGDNTAAIVDYFKALRETILPKFNLHIVLDEVFTPPLPDATGVVQKLREARPDLLFNGATAHSDVVTLLQKMREFGVRVPMIGLGAQFTTREFRDGVGAELIEGLMGTVASHTLKGQEELARRFQERTGEPWMTQDTVSGYAEIWIVKEGLEKAASADPAKLREALATLELRQGPAAQALLPGHIRFNAQGRRVDAVPVLVQWQSGVPYTVYPAAGAARQAVWPK